MSAEVAPGVYRLGSQFINWYVVEDGGRFTLVDTGIAGYWDQLPRLLHTRGSTPADIDAVLITHSHIDHIGSAEHARREAHAPVYVHPEDAPLLREPDTSPPRAPLWRPALLRYFFHVIANRAMKVLPIEELHTFSDGETLDVPGKPRVIHVPGHTPGSAALLFEDRRTAIVGDALGNVRLSTGNPGPQILEDFANADSEQALASLAQLDGIEADVTLFGHGEPWDAPLSEALAAARMTGVR